MKLSLFTSLFFTFLLSVSLPHIAHASVGTATFSASVGSGSAPLSVTFSNMVNTGNSPYGLTATINFGDGQSATATPCYAPTDSCSSAGTNTHTYASPGTYTATLVEAASGQGCKYSLAIICPPPYDGTPVTLGTISITVTAASPSNSTTFIASPTSGHAPLSVTFSNMVGGGMTPYPISFSINYGDGQTEGAHSCYAPTDFCLSPGTNTHTYATAGTYTATLIQTVGTCPTGASCPQAGPTTIASVTVTVTGGTTQQGNVYASVSHGDVPLTVTYTGDPGSGCNGGAFTLDYGDGTSADMNFPADLCNPSINKTHTYTSEGSYVATLIGQTGNILTKGPTILVTNPKSTTSGRLRATPVWGNVPLSVTFTGSPALGAGTLYYGDGSSSPVGCIDTCGSTPATFSLTHVYTKNGTYSATLNDSQGSQSLTITVYSTDTKVTCPTNYVLQNGLCVYKNPNVTTTVQPPAPVKLIGNPSISNCPIITRYLGYGMNDNTTSGQVSQLQQFLAAVLGIDQDSLVTGYFGAFTQNYVKRFQSMHKITETGTVGPVTRSAIQGACLHL